MHRFRIRVAYDGTRYHGWQVQQNVPSIAQTLADVLQTVCNEKVSILGISRTDAGVHARDQVAAVTLKVPISAHALAFAWNNALPHDIVIRECLEVPLDYNPFHGIATKIYWYHIFIQRPSPFQAPYGWYVKKRVCLETLQQALQLFVGTHDFRSFSTGDERDGDTVRTIESITIEPVPALHAYRITVQGPAFLHHMIRRIVGAAVDVATKKGIQLSDIIKALREKNPHQPFYTAPAQGLMLQRVIYSDDQGSHNEMQPFFL